MGSRDMFLRVVLLIPMVLSLSVHEWAHAWSAHKLGDDTAKNMGRLTLNPLEHIDVMGTLILPLLGIPFGWAKPVPVNPLRFNRNVSMRTGMAITAAAGPISNFVLALLCTVLLGLSLRFTQESPIKPLYVLLMFAVKLNVSLGLFNLLPVPPLDGSRIASRFFSSRFPQFWSLVERYSTYLLLGVMLLGGQLIAGPSQAIDGFLMGLVSKLAYS